MEMQKRNNSAGTDLCYKKGHRKERSIFLCRKKEAL